MQGQLLEDSSQTVATWQAHEGSAKVDRSYVGVEASASTLNGLAYYRYYVSRILTL